MIRSNGQVIFINKHQAEILEPVSGAVLISVNDSRETEADLQPDWEKVLRYYFIDGTYNEESLRYTGRNYKYIYSAYFDSETAHMMRSEIHECIEKGTKIFIVHCHAGRSRSAAIAKYIHDKYGYNVGNDVGHLTLGCTYSPELFSQANLLVYTLLQNPEYYSSVIQEIEDSQKASTEENQPSIIQRLISVLTGNN